ncbi:HAD-IA family hydrolase [Paracoccus sp. TK19116]|uniref:HAD-IA family hydrolase n=1 Tax=Paracoccus albicereus TaxID=2922394 RepID=A0ABT1MRI2_9RHOB|nr:HAD-IA family hydrolase [Paracoccus albicereus]MCQ0970925.1 HAD-IA family hydrolase [Paracoccus albicereus]
MKLIIFDVDGTLVDSQHHIHRGMGHAFDRAGLPAPGLDAVLETVGLSLPHAIARLAPDADEAMHARLADGYRAAFHERHVPENAPLYPGAQECLDALGARDDLLLAVATGKGRRGLDVMLQHHGLQGRFVSLQTADGHPSKPHPAMLHSALAETGVDAVDAVMVGDTSFDMAMAVAAGVTGFGVGWGYHAAADLKASGAVLVASDFSALTRAIDHWVAEGSR